MKRWWKLKKKKKKLITVSALNNYDNFNKYSLQVATSIKSLQLTWFPNVSWQKFTTKRENLSDSC